jgi:hypothetical protein
LVFSASRWWLPGCAARHDQPKLTFGKVIAGRAFNNNQQKEITMTQALQTTTTALQTAGVFNSMQALEQFGQYIFQSNMFGARNPAEGFILGVTCQQENMTLMQFKERYHIIQGQIAMKSEAMLANLLELGGEYEIVERSPERAAVKVTFKKATMLSELKWEDAQKEDYVKAKNGQLKDNWSTPRRRMQMMWARVVSDGVRAVCPLATRGHYTPEEAIDFDDQPKAINVTPAPVAYPQETTAAPVPSPAPIVEAPAEPPMQPVTQPTAAAKPMPMFQAPKGPDDLDYTICRIEGKMCGKKWAEMPTEHLQLALQITDPNLYQQDREQIEALIMQRSAAVDIADN